MSAPHYTEAEVLALIVELTPPRLTAWVEARIVQPVLTETGPAYRDLDLARLRTLCDLDDSYGLGAEALGLVMSLMDQVHVMHADLEALMAALSAETPDVRARVRSVVEARVCPSGEEG